MTLSGETHQTHPAALRPRLALASPILGNAAYIVEISGFSVILASFAASSGTDPDRAVWIYSVYSAVVAIAILAGGWIGDRFSARLVFVLGMTLFILGGVGFFFATTLGMLLVARLLQGAGGGLFSPMVPVLLIAGSKSTDSKILSSWAIISGLVAAAAPLTFTMLSDSFGWRAASLAIPGIALSALVCTRWLPRTTREHEPRKLPRSTAFWMLAAHVFCVYGLTTYFLYVVPLQAVDIGISHLDLGTALSALWLAFAAGSGVVRKLNDDRHLLAYLVLGVALDFIAIALFLLSPATITLFAGAIILGAGMALNNVPTTVLMLRLAPPQSKGMASSIDIVAARAGGIATVSLLGTSPSLGLIGMIALSVLAVALLAPLFGTNSTAVISSTN